VSIRPQLKFSFDIGSKKAGIELIKSARELEILDRLFITDTRLRVLRKLREYSDEVNLIHTIPHRIAKLEPKKIEINPIKNLKIDTLNIKANKYYESNFNFAVENDFNCFFWGVNTKIRMKRLMKMEINGSRIDGLYTDYPDHAVSICKELFEGKK
jgi:hypothetical protein